MTELFTTVVEGIKLANVHAADNCIGRPCVIHNPTGHHMRGWRLHWRDDRGIFVRICPHGVGHPDPDQFDYWDEAAAKWDERQRGATRTVTGWSDAIGNPWVGLGVHVCDGCCQTMQYDDDGI